MRRKNGLMVAIVIVLIIIVGAYAATMHVNISALPEPGPFEISIATKAKDWYISRGSTWLAAPGADQRRLQRFHRRNVVRHGVRDMPRAGRAQADTHRQGDVSPCPRPRLTRGAGDVR